MWGHEPGWGMGGWGMMGGFGLIFWLLVLGAVIAATVWLVRSMAQRANQQRPAERRSPGLEVLEERYARGEISREEYLQKKRDIAD